jgi:hypothetical protein
MIRSSNLFADLPPHLPQQMPDEVFTSLLEAASVRIVRIVKVVDPSRFDRIYGIFLGDAD